MDGEKQLMIGENRIDVKSTILSTDSLSAHADQDQLVDYARRIKGGGIEGRELM